MGDMYTKVEKNKNHSWIFPILEYRVLDGDTIAVKLDLGMSLTWEGSVRLDGINTPEVRGSEKRGGVMVKQVAEQWLSKMEKLVVHSSEWGKYAERIMGEVKGIYQGTEVPCMLADTLLTLKLGVPYDGKTKKKKFTEQELDDIISIAEELLRT